MKKKTQFKLSQEDAWRIYELVEELQRYLHQPDNYANPEQVTQWLKSGVYAELKHVYCEVTGSWFPVDEATSNVHASGCQEALSCHVNGQMSARPAVAR